MIRALMIWIAKKLLGSKFEIVSSTEIDTQDDVRQWTLCYGEYDDPAWDGPLFDGYVQVVEKSAYDKLRLVNTRLRATIAINEIEKDAGW